MYRLLLALVLLIVAAFPQQAQAQDHKFISNDAIVHIGYNYQVTHSLLRMSPEGNHGAIKWRNSIPSPGQQLVQNAINLWEVVPGMPPWFDDQRVTHNGWDVDFKIGSCISPGAIACAKAMERIEDTERDTYYIQRVEISFPDWYSFTDPKRQYILAHEFGHALGLADRYGTNGCGNGPLTLMDTDEAWGQPCPYFSAVPTTFDSDNLRDYWKNCDGAYTWCGASVPYGNPNTSYGGSTIDSVWEHQAFNTQHVFMHYYGADCWTCQFTLKHTNHHVSGVGFWSNAVHPYGSNDERHIYPYLSNPYNFFDSGDKVVVCTQPLSHSNEYGRFTCGSNGITMP